MNILLAESAGFCEGVSRAVKMTETALEEGPLYSLGELIHNKDAVERLSSMGLRVAEAVSDVPDGARVIIRSHGVSRDVIESLRQKGCTVIDATCPRVSRIHKIVERASNEGRQVIVFGEPSHPEVQGICGWCGDALVAPDMETFRLWENTGRISEDMPLTVV